LGIKERKEREREQRRDAILDAAKGVFSEKGLQASTMDEIADHAELSKPTLYLYFGNKEDLYQAVAVKGLETLEGMILALIEERRPTLGSLLGLFEVHEEFFRSHREYFRMFTSAHTVRLCRQVSEETLQAHRTATARIREIVIALLGKGKEEGLIRPELDPAQITAILWSSGNALMQFLDIDQTVWKETMEIDLWSTLRLSNRLLLEAILTDAGKESLRHLPASP
jgi:TetR/AcrR family transcriptional regulator